MTDAPATVLSVSRRGTEGAATGAFWGLLNLMNHFLHHLRRTMAPAEGDVADGPLLERFVTRRDEAAFETLLRRHGPMVLGVCRRVLRRAEDVEDAFQATFLVLVRKAASLRRRELVGNWLYGVAYRAALEANASARRRARERQVSEVPEPASPGGEAADWDLRAILDEELNRLPDKYRAAVVLCELEGRTRKEAARELGIPEGTLSSRLATARALLGRRLAARGVTLSAAALAGAAVPPALNAAVRGIALGTETPIGAGTQLILEGVMRTMLVQKLKSVGALLLVVGLLGGGVGMVGYPAPDGKAQAQAPAAQAKPKSEDKKDVKGPNKPSPAESDWEPASTAERLRQPVEFPGFNDPKTTLLEALEKLSDLYDVRFHLREEAFVDPTSLQPIKEFGDTPVASDRPIPRGRNLRLDAVLRAVLAPVGLKHPGTQPTFLVRVGGVVEVTTLQEVRKEILDQGQSLLSPVATVAFDRTPLDAALRHLSAGGYDLSIVLDARAADKAKTPITARFANVPLDTVVRLLADMADLRMVRLDNVLYVTGKDNVEPLRKQHDHDRSGMEAIPAPKGAG